MTHSPPPPMKKAKLPKKKIEEGDVVRPTGIPELDQMLHGGLPTNAAILLAGPPGSGKTILALQWMCAGYHDFQESGIYFTLTEPTTKLIKNLKKLNFSQPDVIASADGRIKDFNDTIAQRPGIHLIDLRVMMRDLGIKDANFSPKDISKLCEAIVDAVSQSGAKRVVIDSITALAYRLRSDDAVRTLVFELGTYLGAMDANVLMTGEASGKDDAIAGVQEFIADGVIRLAYLRTKNNRLRTLEIVKMRGISFDSNVTAFRINHDGIKLFPRMQQQLLYRSSLNRVTSGVAGFDEMLGGGYFEGTSILLSGASGSGKTILALQCLLGGLKAGKKALLVSFEESRDHLVKSLETFGWDLAKYEADGLLSIIAAYPEERSFDEHLSVIHGAIEEFGPSLLVIDSISAIANKLNDEDVQHFTSQLIAYTKNKQITCVLTAATANLTGASESISGEHLSTITDTIILLRFVEIQSELRHALLILKVRGSNHDKGLREYVITSNGIEVTTKFSGYEGLLAGSTRKVSQSTEEQLHSLFVAILGPMGEVVFLEEKRKGLTYENVRLMVADLTDQGIISTRRKEEFLDQASHILNSPATV